MQSMHYVGLDVPREGHGGILAWLSERSSFTAKN